jgi:putative ABC transport system permease protein
MALPFAYNVRSLLVRWKSTLLAMIGIAFVVAVLVALLSMASGFRSAFRPTGSAQNAILLQKGAQSEIGSSISKASADSLALDSRIARAADGKALVSPELVTVVALPKVSNGRLSNVTVRGITQRAFDVRDGIRIVQGRRMKPGVFELIVGKQIQSRFRGLDVGSRPSLMKREFEVVGVFDADGSAFESELWVDYDAMASAFNRAGTESSITVRLSNPSTLPELRQELDSNPRYQLQTTPELQFYEEQAGPLSKFLQSLAAFVSIVMGIGAVFAAMNTMDAVIASRTREIGTLRALGFSRTTILATFVLEGLILAVAGGILGCVLSLAMVAFKATTTANLADVVFGFQVTLTDLAYGMLFAVAMGVVGSFLPAVRASRVPIIDSLREA